MAIAVDNTTTKGDSSYDATHTISGFECDGTDSHLFVAAFNRNVDSEVTGITANANNMSSRGASVNANVCGAEAWDYKISNASFNIVASTPGYKLCALAALALSGVHQTTPTTGTPETSTGYSTTATDSYTGTSGNLLLVLINCQNARTLTASNCTESANFDHTDANLGQCFVGYVQATGSAQTIGATLNSNDNWAVSIVEVAASAASVTPFIRSALIL